MNNQDLNYVNEKVGLGRLSDVTMILRWGKVDAV